MGGGLLQLVAKGPQDSYLTGNPQITYFKNLYKHHTNFAIEQIEQTFLGERDFGKRIRCKLDRKADLLTNMYLAFDIIDDTTQVYGYAHNIYKFGFKIIDYVEIEIGGQVIDRHYGEWMDIWTQLTYSTSKYSTLMSLLKDKEGKFTNRNNSYIYVPLMFWFNIEPGLALPLISLQYHEVVLYLNIKSKDQIKYIYDTTDSNELVTFTDEYQNFLLGEYTKQPLSVNTTGAGDSLSFFSSDAGNTKSTNKWQLQSFSGSINDIHLFCDYIFLDTEERKLFANNSHEYLIEQVQRTNKLGIDTLSSTTTTKNKQFELDFNHPVKEIIWTVNSDLLENTHIYKNMDLTDTLGNILLQMNGIDRIKQREVSFFNMVQPFQYHTCGGLIENSTRYYNGGFYMYSFGLFPEKINPSGTLNFSRLNNFIINFDYNKTSNTYSEIDESYTFTCYAKNYNILKIGDGMAGVIYKN